MPSIGATIEALLLDTHTFLWAISQPERLSRRAHRWLVNPRIKLHLSVASIWEIELKHAKGKLDADDGVVNRQMDQMGIHPIAITAAHVRGLAFLNQSGHKDPFDRLIASQAVVEGLSLVTRDPAFEEYQKVQVVW